jgi:hypothetical protein
MTLINCHDCGQPVSRKATSCPTCGSAEPSGPYQFTEKEIRRHRIEERNDRNLIVTMMILGAIGAFYGVETGSDALSAIVGALIDGFVGLSIAVPLAFAINLTRNWR